MTEKPKTENRGSVKVPNEIPVDTLQKLEAEHGEILLVKTVLGQVAFRGPRRSEYQRFHKEIHNEKQRHLAGENLIRACVVHPELKQFDDMLERKPGIGSTCSNALTEFAGADAEAEQKKVGSD